MNWKKTKQTCVVGKVVIMLMQPRIVPYMERVSLITANFKIEQFSTYINLHFSSSESLIFTSQVSDLLTLVYPLADSASVDMMCSEVPGHPINLHIVDRFNYNCDTSFKLFSCCLLCVNGKKILSTFRQQWYSN